tara:strand:- start:34392 stop:34877 length:486 start_codon:yes stop_codon:yes gene_type:complete
MGHFLRWLERAELICACTCLALAATSLFADVFAREIIGGGIYGVQKFAVYCCAISGALGISVVVHKGGHLRISAIDSLYPPSVLVQVGRLCDLLSAGVCVFLAWYSAKFVFDTYSFQETDTILNVPIWRIQIALPIAFSLAAVKYLAHAFSPALKPEEGAI